MPSLKIACQGADTLPYTELTEFQGELKSLSKSDFEAMRRQLVENGFSFPIALWVSPEGNNCILDGHQRLRVIRELAKEGWTIPELPVTWVEADNEQQAKEKLLAAAGAFGTVSDQGLYELITSADLDIDRIAEMTRFRELPWEKFQEEYFDINQGQNLDYSIIDGDDKTLDIMRSEVKKAIQIEFELSDYDEASALVKYWRERGAYVGGLIMDFLKKEKSKL